VFITSIVIVNVCLVGVGVEVAGLGTRNSSFDGGMADLAPPTPARAPVVFEMAEVLGCGLDRTAVQLLLQLIEAGVNPEALAGVVRELKRERAAGAASGTTAR
jgi:hypothetical protein